MASGYRIPAQQHRTEITVVNSRFITSISAAPTVDDARAFIAAVRAEMPDASHHVYAFCVGYGHSIIEGMSDDGEPTGTSGPPTLAVLRGADIGDVVLITTRYFGGTKLGTGGLVRAYSDSARTALESLPTTVKAHRTLLGVELAYTHYENAKRLITACGGQIESETFDAQVLIEIIMLSERVDGFAADLREMTAGQSEAVILDSFEG